jgi:hypothetical protein
MPIPLKEEDATNPQVKLLILNCTLITNGRIYLHRWNIEKENAPIGFAVKEKDVQTITGALESLIGKGCTVTNCLKFDLSTHSGIKGTHLNIYHNTGKLELQGNQIGDGRSKRFPPSNKYACEGFLDVLHHLSSALESQPESTPPTESHDMPATHRAQSVRKESEAEGNFSRTENEALQRIKSFLSELPLKKKKACS